MKKLFYILPAMALLGACSPKLNTVTVTTTTTTTTTTTRDNTNDGAVPEPVKIEQNEIGSKPQYRVLKATAFKMSGDYADHVAVTLGADGRLLYYPAPSDLSAASVPTEIGDGWWLNRQGIGEGSVFTKWTFDEYRALKSVPSQEEIKAAIIPGARVTAFRNLAVPASEAARMTPAELMEYLK